MGSRDTERWLVATTRGEKQRGQRKRDETSKKQFERRACLYGNDTDVRYGEDAKKQDRGETPRR